MFSCFALDLHRAADTAVVKESEYRMLPGKGCTSGESLFVRFNDSNHSSISRHGQTRVCGIEETDHPSSFGLLRNFGGT
jgi:hypothetical protein